MDAWLSALIVIAILMSPLSFYFFLWLVKFSASKNFIWTIVKEGTCKAVMTADGAAFRHFLMQYKGHWFTKKENNGKETEWEITGEQTKAVEEGEEKFKWFKDKLGLRGIRFLGLPGFFSIYVYKFRGLAAEQSKEGSLKFERSGEITDYVDVRDSVIRATIKEAEDSDFIPLTIILAIRFKIINPYKTLFVTESSEWLAMLANMLLPIFRKHVAKAQWQAIQRDENDFIQRFMTEIGEGVQVAVNGANAAEQKSSIKDSLKDRYGIDIITTEILNVDPEGEVSKQIREASIKKFDADREAEKIQKLAEAEGGRIETVYRKIQEFGDLGEFVRRLEALEKVGASGKLVISAPELSAFARGFGLNRETAEDLAKQLTSKNIDEIKQIIEKHLKK